MQTDLRLWHNSLVKQLELRFAGNTQKLRVKKNISNLFRYDGRKKLPRREIDLRQFDKPLYLDSKKLTLDVQALATYEEIVDFLLPHGLLPFITPELKHITIGGATVGIGIEANSFRYGFVHNGLIEAELLLSNGRVISCSPTEHNDLFYGLANSYGTLGYLLRVKIKLRKVKPYMTLETKRFDNPTKLLAAIQSATKDSEIDSVESLVYSEEEQYLTIVRQSNEPRNLMSIYGSTVFYKEISKRGLFSLPTKEYLFRYDPEWFWNMPENRLFHLFRKFAPQQMRNSGFYTRYGQQIANVVLGKKEKSQEEQLIQDWEVPWKEAAVLLNFVLDSVDLCGLPLLITPVNVPQQATFYPMKPNTLYFNLGSYSFVKKEPDREPYHATKIIDKFCFAHEGIKMLYSTTFLPESAFNRIYNGSAYRLLKQKYDPLGLLPTLYEKAVKSY